MATDLGPSGSAEYTTVVQRPDTGEALNESALNNMLLPLINRTDYLAAGLTLERWRAVEVFDDFLVVEPNVAADLLHTSTGTWHAAYSGSATQTFSLNTATDDAAGAMRLNVSGASTGNLILSTGGGVLPMTSGITRRITARVAFEDASVTGRVLEIGMSAQTVASSGARGSVRAMTLLYDDDEGSGWYLRTHDGSSETIAAIPDSTMSANTFAQIQLTYDGDGNVAATFNGGTAATSTTNVPSDTGTMDLMMIYESPSSGNRDFLVDYIDFQGSGAARVV